MMNITTKQFQILSDIDLVWNFLTDIYVREGVRQQGIARRLLSACENWAKAKGCTEFASDCELDNKDSQLFHQAVGFDDYWDDAPEIAHGNYCLWRLMIDKAFQKKGYGRDAVGLALDFIRTFPCGPADFCWTSYEPENEVACRLYHSFGFSETGEKDVDELIAVLPLREM